MKNRSIAAITASAVLALTACGGGGSSTLSEDDFVDALADLCDDTHKDLEDLDEPESPADVEDFANDAVDVLTDARERLGDIAAPSDLANDFADFVDNIDDQIKQLEKLAEAAKDEDEDAIAKILTKIGGLNDDQSQIAGDLDVEECDPNAGDEPTDTTAVTSDTTADTAAPTTTAGGAPLTLPPTVPQTLPPATAAPGTAPPSSGQLFTVVDLTTLYVAPAGFSLVHTEPTQATIDAIVAIPELNQNMSQVGVATLYDKDGTAVADIWIGVAFAEMPAEWKTLDCPGTGDLRTSEGGIIGIVCLGAADSPTWEIFTATQGSVGISVYTLLPDIGGDLVADAFLEANL